MELSAKTSSKEQHAVVRAFLQEVTGVSLSELYRSSAALSATRNPVEAAILTSRSAKQGNVFEARGAAGQHAGAEAAAEGGVLGSLFGDEEATG